MDPEKDTLIQELSELPPPPAFPASPPPPRSSRPVNMAVPSQKVGPPTPAPGEPGAILRKAPEAKERTIPTGWAAPSEQQERNRKRVKELRDGLSKLLDGTNKAVASLQALSKALRDTSGGLEESKREGFDLDLADQFITKLDAVMDEFTPPAQS